MDSSAMTEEQVGISGWMHSPQKNNFTKEQTGVTEIFLFLNEVLNSFRSDHGSRSRHVSSSTHTQIILLFCVTIDFHKRR